MTPSEFWSVVERIRAVDGRYGRDAYGFVMDALEHTVSELPERRHISGEELVRGLCRHARDRFGMLAYTVFERWGMTASADIGVIVFQLVEAGVLARREEDAIADFDDVVDLKEALEDSYFDDDARFA